jgi:anti-sigma factor RsiW
MTGVFDRGCERAQSWASLELDGELSQLERVLLATHLRRCDACAERVAGMRAVTVALRSAPLEAPAAPVFVASSRNSRSRPLALRIALAATLTAVAAGLGVLAGSIGGGSPVPAAPSNDDLALLPVPQSDSLRDQQGIRPSERSPRDQAGLDSSQLVGGV